MNIIIEENSRNEMKEYTGKMEIMLNDLGLKNEEKEHRTSILRKELEESIERAWPTERLLQLMHEIKSAYIFRKHSKFKLAEDYNNESGPDIRILNNYAIECVCASEGSGEYKNKLKDLRENKIIDLFKRRKTKIINTNVMHNLSLPRLTQVIEEKRNKFEKYLSDPKFHVKKDDVCIIFVGLGNIAYNFYSSSGNEFLKPLIGLDKDVLFHNKETNAIVHGYEYIDKFNNINNAPIEVKYFESKRFEIISGIIFSDAHFYEDYTKDNTYLFVNPNAKNKINTNYFEKDMKIWTVKQKISNDLYEYGCINE